MNYLIAGLAKSGTTMLFSRLRQALSSELHTFFEPHQNVQFEEIFSVGSDTDTLSKVLIGRVLPDQTLLNNFDKHVVIYRDPRDQFVSMLLYLFYDFQVSGDQAAYDTSLSALRQKQQNPAEVSAIALYNQIADYVGRAPIGVFNKLHRVQSDYLSTFMPCKLRYEDLLDGKWASLEAYLGLDLSQKAEVPREYSRVVRSRGYGDWRHWLNEDDLAYVNSQWGEAILALGYEIEEPLSQQIISETTTTDYVRQFDPQRAV